MCVWGGGVAAPHGPCVGLEGHGMNWPRSVFFFFSLHAVGLINSTGEQGEEG